MGFIPANKYLRFGKFFDVFPETILPLSVKRNQGVSYVMELQKMPRNYSFDRSISRFYSAKLFRVFTFPQLFRLQQFYGNSIHLLFPLNKIQTF